MTAAHDLFLREFHATGRESMDGISIYSLADLNDQERAKVRQILAEAFRQRDERAPRPLSFIDPAPSTRPRCVKPPRSRSPRNATRNSGYASM